MSVSQAQSCSAEHAAPVNLETLRQQAASGDQAAITELGLRQLVGEDAAFAPEEGVALLERAAEGGQADALCALATLRGAGAWTHQSWPEALELLQRAAERGSADAQTQLRLLSSDADLTEQNSGVWQGLRDRIDLKTFVTPSPPVQVCDSPRIWIGEKFATAELCRWLIGRSTGKLKPALMRDVATGVARPLESRTCSDFVFDIVSGGVIMLLLRVRISALTSIPVPHMEPPQIFHYAVGQEIKAHFDFLFDGTHSYGTDGKYTGDRLATFLMYLNDGYEGGELEFPKAGYSYKGRIGDAIFFASQRDGKPDHRSLHAAKPIIGGEKYILSQWIHNQPFRA